MQVGGRGTQRAWWLLSLLATEVDGQRYPFELQLCTRRASVASDLEHNTCYEPYVPLSDQQRAQVRQLQAEPRP